MRENLPAMQETRVQSLGWEDPLERPWQPPPVFLPGELHGQRTLVGDSPEGGRESDVAKHSTAQPSVESVSVCVYTLIKDLKGVYLKCGSVFVPRLPRWR